MLHTLENDEPAEGDLLFLRLSEPEEGEEEPLPDHIAVFTGLGEVDEMRTFKVIEVWGDRVIAGEYPDDDPALMGFMAMPDAQAWKQAQLNSDLPAQTFVGEAGGVKVSVEADAGAFPADTTMVVTTVAAEDLPETVTEAVAGKVSGVEAVDIAFYNKDGEEIEPLIPIRVSMTAPRIAHAEQSQVVHVTADGEANLVEQTPTSQLDEEPAEDQIVFDADGFSVYAIVYTVDFHYEVNGKVFELSLPGGGFVSFRDLVGALNILGGENADGNEAETERQKETDEALKLTSGGEAAHDAAKKFVANISSITFSNPAFVDVSRVEANTTVGQLKSDRGLEIQYSSELTEQQIADIDAQTAEAGDWALIALRPFISEETLVVTMKDGDVFTIRVTDAQISAHVITADGEGFVITVTYGPEAKIPDGAVLEADEIVRDSDAYLNYLEQARAALSGKTSDSAGEGIGDSVVPEEGMSERDIGDARFFDIRIMANGVKIEPAEPVKVTIAYSEALNSASDDQVLAVHFGEKGIELIETTSDQSHKEVVFMQSGFSVTGTVVTTGSRWPGSAGSYVMYVQSGGRYYAVNHDGTLHEVTVNNNQVTFPDDEDAFDINAFLWTYEPRSSWFGGSTYFVFYHDENGNDHYLSPTVSSGIQDDSITLTRTDAGLISSNNLYIGVRNGATIAGRQSKQNAVPIQFASFPQKVKIHFVDREGNPLTGVSYTGPDGYPVTANSDGTYSVPYSWNGTSGTLQLDEHFERPGYTYASTHLAGNREGVPLTFDGLTIDAALRERSNALYFYSDPGAENPTLAYGNLKEYNINNAMSVSNEAGNGSTSYNNPNTNKDIYVILDPVPVSTSGSHPSPVHADDPEFDKTLVYNDDGTYTLSLSVKGHGINTSMNPKANVLFVVDTSSSMDKTEGTGTGYSRLHDTKPELKRLAQDLLDINSMSGRESDTIELAKISFDGGVVDELDWTSSYPAFESAVDNGLVMHRGTDWEDSLKRAYEIGLAKQAEEPDQEVFIVFFTDGEGSQYTNFHGAGDYFPNPSWGVQEAGYRRWYSYFLSRESAKDEARAIINAGMRFYAVYAFNIDNAAYNGEAGSDLLNNLVRYAYNNSEVNDKHFFKKATSTEELRASFSAILRSIREIIGTSDVVMNDDITSLTSTGINLVSSAVGGFTYTRSGGRYGEGQTWTNAPEATHVDNDDGEATSVQWDLGNVVLEDGVTYTVSFKVWPSQEAYDWLADLNNGTRDWDDVVAAGLDAPNGANPQFVKNGDNYSLLTNKPSTNSEGEIINNSITYKITHSETVQEDDIPNGTPINTPIEGTDEDGNPTVTTYTVDDGVYTKTVVTEKETYFPNPDPMPLVPERMSVMKKWEMSMNTSHPADQLKFRVLVDGKYYQTDGTLVGGEEGKTNALALTVEELNSWKQSIDIAPGIVKFYDDDNNALDEALVLETGHKYTLEEYDLMENGAEFLYYTSYEFHSQTMRPMIVDGQLKYLVLIDDMNPAPTGAATYTIGAETYFAAETQSGLGTLSGTNYRTAELDITKIILNGSGAEIPAAQLDAESFTYRVTLRIPDGTDPAGIVGYEYVPRTQSNAFTLFGYQTGETAFESDIERFSGKTFRSWNTLVYRDLVEWENVGGRIVSLTDEDGNIRWKAPNVDGYHSITYDMTLNRNEVIRFTNLPTGTQYVIQEIYVNEYQADNSSDSEGHAPISKAGNVAAAGYEISQVLHTNGTVSQTLIANDTVSGTIDAPNVRYYNQFTNTLKSVKVKVTILKTNQDGAKPLPGAVFDLYDAAGYAKEPKEALQSGLVSSSEEGKVGTIELGALSDGVYYLVETHAPAGYNQLTTPVVITVSNGDVSYSQDNTSLDDTGAGKSGDFENGYVLKVVNDAGVELPMTGGMGVWRLMALGLLLTLGAGAALMRRRDERP